MAVVSTTTYLYVDTALNPYYVQGSQLTDRGPWSSSDFYNPPDVVQIGVDQYITLAANSNTPPTGIVDDNWSTLVVVEEAGSTVVNAGSDYYARTLAELALTTAWVGTQIGSSAYNYAEAAYNLAIIGTNNVGGFAIGTDAYHLAESGTNIGWAAYLLAQIGTNTGTAALNAAAAAQSTASSAFSIAVIGTNAAANANAYASIAWALAQMGTNTGTAALNAAATAQSTANSAFSIAVIGTNTGTAAYQLAQTGSNIAYDAYAIAVDGTNAVITEQGTRSQEDQFLQNQITALSITFGSQTGTLVADFSYQIGTLTANLATEQGTRSQADQFLQNQIITEQGTRSQEDQYLQNQIGVLQSILGVGFEGTISLFTAQVRYGKPDTAFVIVDGVLASRQESKFVWDDFDTYGTTTGTTPVGVMDEGSSWNGNGSIYTNNLWVGFNGTDWMNLYSTGTINSSTLNNGTGWASSGTSWGDAYWYRFLGTDDFQSYSVGTLSSSGTELTGGGGWVGGAVVYSGSNRP